MAMQEGKKLSTFEKLPVEIRRKIYDELLKADRVREPPDQFLVCDYHFKTAILGVNKQIYREAHETLYHDNCFIVVSCNWEWIYKVMANHEVAAIACDKPKLVAEFKEHVLRLHMKLPGGRGRGEYANRKPGKVIVSFLLVADELPRFVRMLRIMKATCSKALFKLIVRIESSHHGSPALKIQQLVLEPFRRLNVGSQGLVISGPIDPGYERSLRASMVPEVNWVRGLAWDTYGLLVSIVNVGVEAFHLGSFATARAKYTDCQQVWEIACGNNPRLADFEDDGFHKSCENLLIICKVNLLLAALRDGDWASVIEETEGWVPTDMLPSVTALDKSLLHHCRAIALSTEHNDRMARQNLETALKLDPTNEVLKSHLSIITNRLAAKTARAREQCGKIYSLESLQQLDKPVPIPPPILTPSEFIAGERYLLRHFGYQGDLLAGIEEKAPANMGEIKKLVKQLETERANLKPGQIYNAWIGGGPQPGSQELPDAMQYLNGRLAAWQQGDMNS